MTPTVEELARAVAEHFEKEVYPWGREQAIGAISLAVRAYEDAVGELFGQNFTEDGRRFCRAAAIRELEGK